MLTTKQETFVQGVINGMSQREAYKNAYDAENMSENAIDREASLLMRNPKVSQRFKELRDEMASLHIMSAIERLEWLTEVVKDKDQSMADRLRASDQMNKMQGEYVQKIEADVSNEVVVVIDLVE